MVTNILGQHQVKVSPKGRIAFPKNLSKLCLKNHDINKISYKWNINVKELELIENNITKISKDCHPQCEELNLSYNPIKYV